jgi:hypothetical protein
LNTEENIFCPQIAQISQKLFAKKSASIGEICGGFPRFIRENPGLN